MNQKLILLLLIVAGSALAIVSVVKRPSTGSPQTTISTRVEKTVGEVTVVAEVLEKNANGVKFTVQLDTHVADLGTIDFRRDVTLSKNNKRFSPIAVDEEGGGHHRKATLTFNTPGGRPFSLFVSIAGQTPTELPFPR